MKEKLEQKKSYTDWNAVVIRIMVGGASCAAMGIGALTRVRRVVTVWHIC